MNAEHDRRPAYGNWLRIGLSLLAATALEGGFWALFLPRLFYDDFSLPGRDWVSIKTEAFFETIWGLAREDRR